MKVGDYIYTPRFGAVRIEAIFLSETLLRDAGYVVPTYYEHSRYVVMGKSVGAPHVLFAAGVKMRK